MSRNKNPGETVEKILQISAKLFIEKGYDNTSMQDIANELHMTKGAIYHHFNSKEDLLQQITNTYFSNNEWFIKIKQNDSLNGLEKLKAIFLFQLENEEKKNMDYISYPLFQNPKLLADHIQTSIYKIAPLIKSILDEGIKDNSIRIKNPKQASEVLMILINVWVNPAIFPTSKKDFMEKVHFIGELFKNMGIDIFDEHLKNVCLNYYKSMK